MIGQIRRSYNRVVNRYCNCDACIFIRYYAADLLDVAEAAQKHEHLDVPFEEERECSICRALGRLLARQEGEDE